MVIKPTVSPVLPLGKQSVSTPLSGLPWLDCDNPPFSPNWNVFHALLHHEQVQNVVFDPIPDAVADFAAELLLDEDCPPNIGKGIGRMQGWESVC